MPTESSKAQTWLQHGCCTLYNNGCCQLAAAAAAAAAASLTLNAQQFAELVTSVRLSTQGTNTCICMLGAVSNIIHSYLTSCLKRYRGYTHDPARPRRWCPSVRRVSLLQQPLQGWQLQAIDGIGHHND
jgi:hypothetical protein